MSQKIKTAEEYVKKHFPGIAKETWFPVIVAVAESYSMYTHLKSDHYDEKLISLTKLEFYMKLERKIEKVMNGELDIKAWQDEVSEKRYCLKCTIDDLNKKP